MKLVFLSSSTGWGGLEQNLLRYAEWMQEAGATVSVLSVSQSPLHQKAQAAGLPLETIARQNRHLPWRAALHLRSRLQALSADVLWIRDPRDLPLAALSVWGLSCRLVFQQGMQIDRPKRKPWHRWRFGQIDHWVTPLKRLADEVLRNTPLKPHQIIQIPLALDSHWFAPSKDKAASRKKFDLPSDVKLVGLFGRLDPLKGQDILLAALESASDWHAFIVGSNTANEAEDWETRLRTDAEQRGICDRIHWHGQMESLQTAYAACDVYAMCSASETFGMVTLEALASGIPVIGTDAGGTPELLGHGAHGTLISPRSPDALARALKHHNDIPLPSQKDLTQFHKRAAVESWLKLLEGPPRPAS